MGSRCRAFISRHEIIIRTSTFEYRRKTFGCVTNFVVEVCFVSWNNFGNILFGLFSEVSVFVRTRDWQLVHTRRLSLTHTRTLTLALVAILFVGLSASIFLEKISFTWPESRTASLLLGRKKKESARWFMLNYFMHSHDWETITLLMQKHLTWSSLSVGIEKRIIISSSPTNLGEGTKIRIICPSSFNFFESFISDAEQNDQEKVCNGPNYGSCQDCPWWWLVWRNRMRLQKERVPANENDN